MLTVQDKKHLLEDRIGREFNSWPDLDLVKIHNYDLDDPQNIASFFYLLGTASVEGQLRQVRSDRLPPQVNNWFRLYAAKPFYTENVYITYSTNVGMSSDLGSQNLYVVFHPRKKYDFVNKTYQFETGGLIAEIGCDHDYEVVARGNCWAKSQCAKCGNTFEIDSSG